MKKQKFSIKSADCAVEVEVNSQQDKVEILINKVKNVLPIGSHILEHERFFLILTSVFNQYFKHLVAAFITSAMGKTIEEMKLLLRETFNLEVKIA